MKNLLRSGLRRIGFDVIRTTSLHSNIEQHLKIVLDTRKIDCVIDVGANRGQYGQMLRSIGYGGHIVSYEPVESVFKELDAAARNDPKWSCHQAALGETQETRNINIYSSTVFSSFLEASEYSRGVWKDLRVGEPESVTILRLEDVFVEHIAKLGVQRIMLKLDTQGFDLQAFRGVGARINDIEVLQSELSMIPVYNGMPTFMEVLPEYRSHGFDVSGFYPINRDASLAVIEFDCLMVRRDHPSPDTMIPIGIGR